MEKKKPKRKRGKERQRDDCMEGWVLRIKNPFNHKIILQ